MPHRVTLAVTVAALTVLALLPGCSAPAPRQSPAAPPAAAASARPSGPGTPSASGDMSHLSTISRLVCSSDAESDLEGAIGIAAQRPLRRTFDGTTYSCPYEYAAGRMVLSVVELPDRSRAAGYLDAARARTPGATALPGLGEEAFAAPDGSAYVRKDGAVLHVDVVGLPPRFGQPPTSRSNIAYAVAVVILTCWRDA